MVNHAQTAKEAVYGMLHEYGERNKDGILDYLTDDVIWIGTGGVHEERFSAQEVADLLDEDIRLSPSPYDMEYSSYHEVPLGPDAATYYIKIRFSQRDNPVLLIDTRCTFVSKRVGDVFKICSWHGSVACSAQTEEEYFPFTFIDNIMEKATLDPLTHVMNRVSFEEAINTYLEKDSSSCAFVLVDLDNFKYVNDHFGHQAGDEVLTFVSGILKESVRQTDLVGRLGGDEFVAFLPNLTDEAVISERLNTFLRNIDRPLSFNGESYSPSASVGVCVRPHGQPMDYAQCYKAADEAMYQAKQSGKGAWKKR